MIINELFLDTSGLLCLFDEGDSRHQEGSEIFANAKSLLTTNYVLAEFVPFDPCAWAESRKIARLSERSRLLPRLDVEWVDDLRHQEAMNLLNNRLDKTYSRSEFHPDA